MTPSLAIIGAGLSGLTLSRELTGQASITLFEKARGLGGRMATRRMQSLQWDHGAPFFTARSRAFKRFLAPFIKEGVVAEWHPNITTLSPDKAPYKRPWFEPHYVAVPAMNSLVKAMATGLDIRLQTRVAGLERTGEQWRLLDEQGQELGLFDWVISTAPLPQSRTLLPTEFSGQSEMAGLKMNGCYALLLTINRNALPHWDAARVNDSPLAWIACNHRLPGRDPDSGTLVAHSTTDWAEQHMEADQHWVTRQLLAHFCRLTGIDEGDITHAGLHRWRYALGQEQEEPGPAYLLDPELRLAACGDGYLSGGVEAAFTSARRLAEAWRRLHPVNPI